MRRSIETRLSHLEKAARPRHAVHYIWDDGNGGAEREIVRLRAAGEIDGDTEVVIVSWGRVFQVDRSKGDPREVLTKVRKFPRGNQAAS